MTKDNLGTPARGQVAVGPALARLRKERGFSGAEVGSRAGLSQSTVSRLERGNGLPDPENVRRVAEALDAPRDEVERLVDLAERAHDLLTDLRPEPGSLADRQEIFQDQESNAREIRVFQADLVIGLLQTSDYARSILSAFQHLHGGESVDKSVEEAVGKRILRQSALADQDRSFQFILGEAALTNRLCPPQYMPGQIERIRKVAQQKNVTISIIPADAEWPVAPLHGFTVLDENAVLIDLFNTATSTHGKSDKLVFRKVFDLYAGVATTKIGPILDKHLKHYLELSQPNPAQ